jgi:hypothetical protein
MPELFTEAQPDQVDPNKNYLEELVGEGKKFPSVEELARGKAEADAFIARITAENATYRDEVQKRKTMEEVLDQIKAFQKTETPPINPPNHSEPTERENIFDPSKVEELVQAQFAKSQREQQEKNNYDGVIQVLTEQFGGGFQSVVQARAKELGLGQNFLENLAKTQPQAFLAIMGPSTAPAPTGINTARTPINTIRNSKGWSHFEAIRKSDPTRYNSPANHNEMMKALEAQGDDFYKS